MSDRPIGFVAPWYGKDARGGAESELRELARHLSEVGVSLEVLTTCVRSFNDDWNVNHYAQGRTVEDGIPVRRFPVRKRDVAAFDAVNLKLMKGARLSPREEETFCQEMVNSPSLYGYLEEHRDEYALFVFIPYMFGTTYYGCQVAPEKSVLIPCFHDEAYAYMQCFRDAFSRVRGMVFNSEPERELTDRLFDTGSQENITMGIGLDTDWHGEEARFRDRFDLHDPFVLYAGRKDAGKNVDVLIRYFVEYKRRNPSDLKLVLIGGGDIDIPGTGDVVDLGFVDVQDKYDAYAAATVFCNPSAMESFSLVIMESWLARTPVLVSGQCAVTRDFAVRAQGGLYYEDFPEFAGCLDYLLSHQDVARQMGANGERYVRRSFSWETIIKRYGEYFGRLGV